MKWGETKDRKTHAVLRNGTKIQRANRAGKWYAVTPSRQHKFTSVAEAVAVVGPDDLWLLGKPGGREFDRLLQAKRETK